MIGCVKAVAGDTGASERFDKAYEEDRVAFMEASDAFLRRVMGSCWAGGVICRGGGST